MEEFFQDPITNELMENAVITPYGHSFSEESITQWIMRDHTCPITRQPLELKDLKPNFALRAAIDAYKKQQYAQQQQKLLKTIQNKKKASAAASSSSSSSASNSAPHAAPSAPHHHEHAAPREAASENDEETTEIAHAALPRPASHESIEDGYILVHNNNNSDVSSTDIVNAQLYRPLIADEQLYNVLASHWCGCGTSASHPQHRDMHLSPNIPQKKLMNAYATAGASGKYMSCSPYEWQHETIFAMLDCSIFGNGKDYVLFGRHGIYFYSWPSKPQFVAYRELITEEFKVRPRGSFFVDLGKDRLCSLAGTSMSPEKMVRIVNEIKEICKNNNNNNNSGSGGGSEEQFVVGDYRSVPFTPAVLPSAATQLSEEFVAAFNEFRILHALTWFDSCDRFFKYPSIPPKRLKNAIAKLERANIDLDAHDILGLIDMSMFGNGKEAILFGNGNSSSRCGGGGGGIYVVSWPGDPRFISYESMLANDTQVTAQGDNVLIRRASRSTAASDNNNEVTIKVGLIWIVVHSAVVACIADSVTVSIGLARIVVKRTIVACITNGVGVGVLLVWIVIRDAVIACIANGVGIQISLVRIEVEKAVIAYIANIVTVSVFLVWVVVDRAVVADIADVITIQVSLVWVIVDRTVVTDITNSIIVRVSLVRVIVDRTVVTDTADIITVKVALAWVVVDRTVVDSIGYTVPVVIAARVVDRDHIDGQGA